MKLLDALRWRYATKKFDTTKIVAEEDIEKIKEAIHLAASSYGLQPYKILDIKDKLLREELKPLSWGQSQVTEASHLFIFCHKLNVTNEEVDSYIKLKAETIDIPYEQLAGYGTFVKSKLKEKSKDEIFHWTAKQTYLALGTALDACASLKIDSTPMEGFDRDAINEKLGLIEQGYSISLMLAIGFRDSEDFAQNTNKVRKPINTLFEIV